METVYADYAPKGVRFFYIYKALAHPEWDGYVTPYSLQERFMHMREAKRTLGSSIPWIVDSMENDIKHALGNRPNPEFIVDSEGKVVLKRAWSNPDELRKDLEKLVGQVEKPTTVEELGMKRADPPKIAPTGVVPRLETPGRMRPLQVTPVSSQGDHPYYAKLRAEAERGLLGEEGKGQLYLRFHMDPLYKVHWNNLTAPIRVKLEDAEGITLSESRLEGPKVEQESDMDPREFLVEAVRQDGASGPIRLTASYFACSDEEGWCKRMVQSYDVLLERDRDGGSVARGRMGRMFRQMGEQKQE